MTSKAKTVAQYLAELPEDRRAAIQAVRDVIRRNLDHGFEEGMQYGMIGYYVPHALYPAGYHCDPSQPLPYVCLASQKNHMAVYLNTLYGHPTLEPWFRAEWAKTGKKLDMGKCCIRFKKVEDLALDLIGEAVAKVPLKEFIRIYEESLQANAERRAAGAASKPRTATKAKKPAGAKRRSEAQSRGRRPSTASKSAITAKQSVATKKKPAATSKKRATASRARNRA